GLAGAVRAHEPDRSGGKLYGKVGKCLDLSEPFRYGFSPEQGLCHRVGTPQPVYGPTGRPSISGQPWGRWANWLRPPEVAHLLGNRSSFKGVEPTGALNEHLNDVLSPVTERDRHVQGPLDKRAYPRRPAPRC